MAAARGILVKRARTRLFSYTHTHIHARARPRPHALRHARRHTLKYVILIAFPLQ